MQSAKKDIRALSLEALQDFFSQRGEKAFRGKQVYQWLWNKGVHDFSEMTNLWNSWKSMWSEAKHVASNLCIEVKLKGTRSEAKRKIERFYDDNAAEEADLQKQDEMD